MKFSLQKTVARSVLVILLTYTALGNLAYVSPIIPVLHEQIAYAADVNITCSGQTISDPGDYASGDNVTLQGSGTCTLGGNTTFGTLTVESDVTFDLDTYTVNATSVDVTGTVTHAAESKTGISITTTGGVTINSGGVLDASAKGCAKRREVDSSGNCVAEDTTGLNGAGRSSSCASASGGGHAGQGGASEWDGNGGDGYGSPLDPITLGSGGGDVYSCGGTGGAGGGVIDLNVSGTLTNNGSITANGQDAQAGSGGGGAGGSINIDANGLAGTGTITNDGGDAVNDYGGSGAAGRTAIYFNSDSRSAVATMISTDKISVAAGSHSDTNNQGAVGTAIIVYDPDNDSSPIPNDWDASNSYVNIADDSITFVDGWVFETTEGSGSLALNPAGLEISNMARLETDSSVITFDLDFESGDDALVTERFINNTLTCNAATTTVNITTATTEEFTGNTVTCMAAAATIDGNTYDSSAWNPGTLSFQTINMSTAGVSDTTFSGTITTTGTGSGAFTLTTDTPGNNIILDSSADYNAVSTGAGSASTVTLNTTGRLYITGNSSFEGNLSDSTLTDIDIDSGSEWDGNLIATNLGGTATIAGNINATGSGCLTRYEADSSNVCVLENTTGLNGAGRTSSCSSASGGGYGGQGGASEWDGAGGDSYGNPLQPAFYGSGGGNVTSCGGVGGNGGGIVQLVTSGTLAISGSITADGGAATAGNGGGGSGGSIYLNASAFSGAGTISNNGGAAYSTEGGSGAGGRTALYFNSDSRAAVASMISSMSSTYGAQTSANNIGETGTTIVVYDPDNDSSPIPNDWDASNSYVNMTDDSITFVDGWEFQTTEGSGSLALNPAAIEMSGLSRLVTDSSVVTLDLDFESGDDALATERFINNTLTCNAATTTLNITTATTEEFTGNTITCTAAAATIDGNTYDSSSWSPGTVSVSTINMSTAGVSDTTFSGTITTTGTGDGAFTLTTDTPGNNIIIAGGADYNAVSTGAGSESTVTFNTTGRLYITGSSSVEGNLNDSTLTDIDIDLGSEWDGNVIATNLAGTASIVGNINASASGCLTQYEPDSSNVCVVENTTGLNGAGRTSGCSSASGGGYGGQGGASEWDGAGGDSYGNPLQPLFYGSGGGNVTSCGGVGGNGGGIVQLVTSGTLAISGTISADGGAATGGNGGGGSGGSIYLNASAFSGAGTISNDGGAAYSTEGGSGAGGRTAIYFNSDSRAAIASMISSDNISSTFGTQSSANNIGETGTTIVVYDPDNDSSPIPSDWDASNSYVNMADDSVTFVDGWEFQTTEGSGSLALNPAAIEMNGLARLVTDSTVITLDLDFESGDDALATERFMNNTMTCNAATTTLNITTATTEELKGNTITCTAATATLDGNSYDSTSSWSPGTVSTSELTLTTAGVANTTFSGTLTTTSTGAGAFALLTDTASNNIIVGDSADINTVATGAGTMSGVNITSTGRLLITGTSSFTGNISNSTLDDFDIDSGSEWVGNIQLLSLGTGTASFVGDFNGDSAGCLAGYEPNSSNVCVATGGSGLGGGGASTGCSDAGGGAYGGAGGSGEWGASAGSTYGDSNNPIYFGAGGGNVTSCGGVGGAGGGLLHIVSSGTIDISGSVTVNGGAATGGNGGGGAGGSIYLVANAISGDGTLAANGGTIANTNGGSGGGGRVAIQSVSQSGTAYSGVTYAAGANADSGNQGSDGTLYTLALSAPSQPSITSPTTGSFQNDVDLTATSSTYVSNGLSHQSSDWKITTDSEGATNVWLATDSSNLESIAVTAANGTFTGALADETQLGSYQTYYIFKRDTNTAGDSDWSDGIAFTTEYTSEARSWIWDFDEDPTEYIFNEPTVSIDTSSGSIAKLDDLGGGSYQTVGLAGFPKRALGTFTNSGSALTDHQIAFDVTYDADMQADFDDLRFTTSDGFTEIDYWIETYTASSTATVWVEFPTIAAGSNTFYMYYGNPTASTTSSSANTLLLEEDLSSTPTGTLSGNATFDDDNDYVQLTANTNGVNGHLYYTLSPGDGYISQFQFWTGGGNGADAIWHYAYATSTQSGEDTANGGYNIVFDEYTDEIQLKWNGSTINSVSESNIDNSTWRDVTVIHSGTNTIIELDGTEEINYTDSSRTKSGTLVGWGSRTGGLNNYHRIRNLIFAKFSSDLTDPSFGSEESSGDYSTISISATGAGAMGAYSQLMSVSHVLGGNNEGTVAYQLSTDSSTWVYYDGANWSTASDDGLHNNTITQLNANIPVFPAASSLYFKAFLNSSGGTQEVEVDTITVNYLTALASITGFTVSSTTATTAALSWDTLSDYGFDHYEIWYGTDQGDVESRTGTATEWDNDPDDAALANASTSTTTITGLTAGLTYYARIFASDEILQESNSDTISFNTNQTATLASPAAEQKTDGSNYLDVSFIADDGDDDDTLQVLVQYDVGGGLTKGTLITTNDALSATYGDPAIDNDATYQIGTVGSYVISSSGANTVNVDLDLSSESDIDTTTASIYLTVYDGIATSSPYTISNVTVDTVAPSSTVDVPAGTYSDSQSVSIIAYKSSALTTPDSTATVYYTTDGTEPTTSNYTGSGTGSVELTISETTNVEYFSVDSFGNEGPKYATLYTLSGGTISVDISSPAALLQTSASTTNVTVTASDSNNNVIVGVTVNGVAAEYTGGNFVAGIAITGDDGSFAISAVATNDLAETGSTAINIVRDTTAPDAPVVTITTSATSSSTLIIPGTRPTLTSVYVNGTLAATQDASTDWSYSATLSDGTNSFSFTTRDEAGNESDATTYTVGYDGDNPLQSIDLTAVVDSVAKGSSVEIVATGTYYDETTADLSALVTFINSDDLVGTITDGVFQSLTTGITSISASLNDIVSSDFQLIVSSLGGGSSTATETDSGATPTPSATPTPTPTATPTTTPTPVSSATAAPESSASATPVPSVTPTATSTPIPRISITAQPPIPEFVTPTPQPVVLERTATAEAVVEDTSVPVPAPVVPFASSAEPTPVVISGEELEAALEESVPLPEPTPFVSVVIQDIEPAPALTSNLVEVNGIGNQETQESPELLTTLIGYTVVNDIETADEFINCTDTDGDGVCDVQEELFKSDPHDASVMPEFEDIELEDNRMIHVPMIWKKSYRMEYEDLKRGDIDSDGDGISNVEEMRLGTNPRSADTDGDGISDGLELHVYNTNMLRATQIEEAVAQNPNTNTLSENTRMATLDVSITGTAPVGALVNLYVIDENNVRTKIGQTVADGQSTYLVKPYNNLFAQGNRLHASSLLADGDDQDLIAKKMKSFLKDGVYKVITETLLPRSQAEKLLQIKNETSNRRNEYLKNDFKDIQNLSLVLDDDRAYLKFTQPINVKDAKHYVDLTRAGEKIKFTVTRATVDEYYEYWLTENGDTLSNREKQIKKSELNAIRNLSHMEKRRDNPLAQDVSSLVIIDYARTAKAPGKYTLMIDRGIRSLFGTLMTSQQTSFSFKVSDKNKKKSWVPHRSFMASALHSDLVSFTSEPIEVIIDSSAADINPVPELLDSSKVTEAHVAGKLILDADSNRPILTAELSIPDSSGATSVVANWQSLLLTSSVIADARQGDFKIFAPADLEPGEHTVYVHSVRADGDEKIRSEDIRLKFVVPAPLYRHPIVVGGVAFVVVLLIVIALVRCKKRPEISVQPVASQQY